MRASGLDSRALQHILRRNIGHTNSYTTYGCVPVFSSFGERAEGCSYLFVMLALKKEKRQRVQYKYSVEGNIARAERVDPSQAA